ncbi:MAG: hypothetical protein Q8L66_02545 [Caulobacter sp.]|nr:hypothetical protein [Caulobacter sp.]
MAMTSKDKFIAAARDAGCDETGETFERVFAAVVPAKRPERKPDEKPAPKRRAKRKPA